MVTLIKCLSVHRCWRGGSKQLPHTSVGPSSSFDFAIIFLYKKFELVTLILSSFISFSMQLKIVISAGIEQLLKFLGLMLWGSEMEEHPLFGRGVCKWPGCDALAEDYQAFVKYV